VRAAVAVSVVVVSECVVVMCECVMDGEDAVLVSRGDVGVLKRETVPEDDAVRYGGVCV